MSEEQVTPPSEAEPVWRWIMLVDGEPYSKATEFSVIVEDARNAGSVGDPEIEIWTLH